MKPIERGKALVKEQVKKMSVNWQQFKSVKKEKAMEKYVQQ